MVQLWRIFSNLIPIFILLIPFVMLLGGVLYKRRKVTLCNRDARTSVLVDAMIALSFLGIGLVTLLPMTSMSSRIVQIVPFVSSYQVLMNSVSDSIRIIGFNIILFIPVGFFLSWRLSNRKGLILKVFLIGVIISFTIELAQFILNIGRTANIDDIILNSLGSYIGSVIYVCARRLIPNYFHTDAFVKLKNSTSIL